MLKKIIELWVNKLSSFEDSLKKINEIVELLESGKLSLDDSIKKFEEGAELIRNCYVTLESVKKKVSLIVEKSNGELDLEDDVEFWRFY